MSKLHFGNMQGFLNLHNILVDNNANLDKNVRNALVQPFCKIHILNIFVFIGQNYPGFKILFKAPTYICETSLYMLPQKHNTETD